MRNMAGWAAQYVGIPFEHSGRTHDGVDCYGLVLMVLREVFGHNPPDFGNSAAWNESIRSRFNAGVSDECWERVESPRPGDVVVVRIFGHPFHCGVVAGPLAMLHATSGGSSAIERLDTPMWRSRIVGYYRFRGGSHADA